MARQPKSPITGIINYFMSAPTIEAAATLVTAQAIVRNRSQAPVTINATKGARRTRRRSATGIHDSVLATVPATPALVPKRKRGRPPVTAAAAHTVPTALPADAQGGSLLAIDE